MKKKFKIKWFDGKEQEVEYNQRDKEIPRIIERNKSYVFKNRKKYNRKSKYKGVDSEND